MISPGEPGLIVSFQRDAVRSVMLARFLRLSSCYGGSLSPSTSGEDSPLEWAERILSWRHTGFNVHSLVGTKTKLEAERVGKHMIRPVIALERLSFLEPDGKVGYRSGRDGAGQETEVMDYLEFIARVTSHIPDKGQVMVRYYGLYANAHRGKVKKVSLSPSALRLVEEDLKRIPSKGWAALIRKPHIGLRSAAMIRKVYEVDPTVCPKCRGRMKVVRGQDHGASEADLCRGEAPAVPCFYRGCPDGGRRERGILLSIL
jgi:hypothetical protein